MAIKVLVLGGTGMLGGMVASVLSRDPGFRVRSTQRTRRDEPFFFDALTETPRLGSLLDGDGGSDFVINCIGLTKPAVDENEAARIINSELPRKVLEAASLKGVRVIHISTDGVFSGLNGPYDEEAKPDADDLYGQTKLAGEIAGPNALTLRCSIIGPDPAGKRGLFEWFRSLKPGSQVPGYTNQLWNGVTTRQFADLCGSIISEGNFDQLAAKASIRHFCPNRAVSKLQLLEIFRNELGSQVEIIPQQSETPTDRTLRSRWDDLLRISGEDLGIAGAVEEMLEGDTTRFDSFVRSVVHSYATNLLTAAMKFVTLVGSSLLMIPISVLALAVFYVRREYHTVKILIATFVGALALELTLKLAFHRARPVPFFDLVAPGSYSFPSGHALVSLCVFSGVAMVISQRVTRAIVKVTVWLLALLLALGIGFSRIYLGVHYPSDVLAGYAAGAVWLVAIHFVDKLHFKHINRETRRV